MSRTIYDVALVKNAGVPESVPLRPDVHDHWEGASGVDTPLTPVGATKRDMPDLYREYMSDSTPAVRRYEIADQLYALGYSLPYIPDLYKDYRSETTNHQEVKTIRKPRNLKI